ncbi:MAG: hypothetical protein KDI63_09380 [Gammaproteobacteria bacterium]|nr:hypothetical protein [Gammaproteobacteria bacterium]
MNHTTVDVSRHWNLATEKFFYYFLGLRKADLRRQVEMMQSRYPDDSPERLARRFIAAQTPLSLVGSALIHAPIAIPAAGPLLRLLGVASGTTVMMVLNMSLVLQIALAFGFDIDDRARLRELWAVVFTTGLASGSTVLLPQFAALNSAPRAVAGGTTVVAASRLIGEAAIHYFSPLERSVNRAPVE